MQVLHFGEVPIYQYFAFSAFCVLLKNSLLFCLLSILRQKKCGGPLWRKVSPSFTGDCWSLASGLAVCLEWDSESRIYEALWVLPEPFTIQSHLIPCRSSLRYLQEGLAKFDTRGQHELPGVCGAFMFAVHHVLLVFTSCSVIC